MTTMDIHKTRFEAVEICGVPALFTVERVRRSELPNGMEVAARPLAAVRLM